MKTTKKNVNLFLVSIDPETDTPKKLSFSIANKMEKRAVDFLCDQIEESTREFAAVLAVNYKKNISNGFFSHLQIL